MSTQEILAPEWLTGYMAVMGHAAKLAAGRLQAALDCINGAEAAVGQPTLDDLRAAEDAAREANAQLAFVGEALQAMSGETSDAHHAVTLLQPESHAAREPEDPEPDWL